MPAVQRQRVSGDVLQQRLRSSRLDLGRLQRRQPGADATEGARHSSHPTSLASLPAYQRPSGAQAEETYAQAPHPHPVQVEGYGRRRGGPDGQRGGL